MAKVKCAMEITLYMCVCVCVYFIKHPLYPGYLVSIILVNPYNHSM